MSVVALWAPPSYAPPEPEPPPPDVLVWSRDEPAVIQSASWTCSCASAAWVMNTMGVPKPDGSGGKWNEWTAVDELRRLCGYSAVTPEYGLAYADMSQMEVMYQAQGLETIRWLETDFWGVATGVAGQFPGQMNGARWYHHSGLRNFNGSQMLLANPAPSWKGVGQDLDTSEWATWGAWRVLFVVGRM
jgi:hypothetical protein